MTKCKYAGDVNDINCKECDGLSMVIDDKEVKADECLGYVPDDSTTDTETDFTKEDDKLQEQTLANAEKTDTIAPKVHSNNTATSNSTPTQATGHTVKISFMSGISVEKDGMWYKFEIGEEQTVSDLTPDTLQEAKKNLYNKLNSEIDEQVNELFKN